MWPADGSQPFVWSMADKTGYGIHGDYVFGKSNLVSEPRSLLANVFVIGWKGDALQRAMDAGCNSDLFSNKINCPTLKTQSLADCTKCTAKRVVKEDIDSWLPSLPGGMKVA